MSPPTRLRFPSGWLDGKMCINTVGNGLCAVPRVRCWTCLESWKMVGWRFIRNGTQAVPYGALAALRFNRPFHNRNLVGAVRKAPYEISRQTTICVPGCLRGGGGLSLFWKQMCFLQVGTMRKTIFLFSSLKKQHAPTNSSIQPGKLCINSAFISVFRCAVCTSLPRLLQVIFQLFKDSSWFCQ